ncbi:response regulator transcription factor [Caballeronia telluris]|uniref:LuxR family transcriptional regulator n=1 Tax=Caballeronia telluris TaxID=326475 RepID=A0A158GNI8_9BURK|nr:response regulator transcription factor [Caballeronia telluris]SAL33665.1 LuxR family transcriptional regulator [Caballeronia telluris]
MSDEPLARNARAGPIRVAVIALSAEVRAGIEALVASHEAFRLVASASDLATLAGRLDGATVDVLVIDMEAEPADFSTATLGIDAFVFLTGDPDSDALPDLDLNDAIALLSRNASRADIAAAIEATAAGLCVLSRETLARLLDARKPQRHDGAPMPPEALSAREMEVLAMLAEGLGNKDIARLLVISENTVKFHLSSIFGKLGANNRTEAVMLGMRYGLVMM